MPQILVPLANGFEEIEAISIIDICRRGEIDVIVAGVGGKTVMGAHNIPVIADCTIDEVDVNKLNMIVLPGGWGGTEVLATNATVQSILKQMKQNDCYIGAICAAPYALNAADVLSNNYTCYPSIENKIRIQGYDKNGNPNFHTQINTGFYMESALIHDNRYFVAEEQHLSANTVRLLLYWIDNGVLVQQTTVNKDIKGIYSKNPSTIILLANDASANGKVLFYDIPSGGITSPFNVSLNQIDDCLEINTGTYLVVEGGDITTVNVNSFTSAPYLTGVNANNIWYDELTNELYVASGNSLDIYDYGTKSLKGNYVHTDIIKDVVFWYNK